MKRIVLLFIGIFASITLFAQSQYLGKVLDDSFLDSFFEEYELSQGRFDTDRYIYPNSVFNGVSNRISVKIETNSDGKISTINCVYKNFNSKESIVSFADMLVKHTNAKVIRKEVTDNRLNIKAQISSSPYNYKTMTINSHWSYNNYGEFFFGDFWVFYSWLSL